MHVYNIAYVPVCMHVFCTCVHVCRYNYVLTLYVYVSMHALVPTFIPVCEHAYKQVCMYCMQVCVYACISMHEFEITTTIADVYM